MNKSKAIECANVYLKAHPIGNEDYTWIIPEPKELGDKWYFEFTFKHKGSLPPEQWESFGGAPGFTIDKASGEIVVISWNDQEIPALASSVPSVSVGVKEKERKSRAPEGGKSLPLTWFLVILLFSIIVGYFFGGWWILILFGIYLFVGVVSAVVRWKLENRHKNI